MSNKLKRIIRDTNGDNPKASQKRNNQHQNSEYDGLINYRLKITDVYEREHTNPQMYEIPEENRLCGMLFDIFEHCELRCDKEELLSWVKDHPNALNHKWGISHFECFVQSIQVTDREVSK